MPGTLRARIAPALTSFELALNFSLVPEKAVNGTATFTRSSIATVMGYQETDNSGAAQTLLTIPSGIPRFEGARFIASNNTWSGYFADGVAIPDGTLHGYLAEGLRTNYILNSSILVTQNITVTAIPYTLSFYGTGSVSLSGAYTGSLIGTGVGNRVALTFTPSAGALTLIVTGTDTNSQLEAGSFASSYIPTTTAAVPRAVDILTYPTSGNMDGTKGTAYVELMSGAINGNQLDILDAYNSGGASGISMSINPSTHALQFLDGTPAKSFGIVSLPILATKKIATKWSNVTSAGFVNGAKSGTNQVFDGDMGFAANICIGNRASGVVAIYGTIRNVKFWKNALSDSNLLRVTT